MDLCFPTQIIMPQKVIASRVTQENDKLWYPIFTDDTNTTWKTTTGYSSKADATLAAKSLETYIIRFTTTKRQFKPFSESMG